MKAAPVIPQASVTGHWAQRGAISEKKARWTQTECVVTGDI